MNQTTTVPKAEVTYEITPSRLKVMLTMFRRALLMAVAAIDAYLSEN